MFGVFGKGLLGNLVESFVDNVIRDQVSPVLGSIVYCELALGSAEHSGVYVGKGKIVHLNGNGVIKSVSPSKFMKRLGGFNTAISIYVSCRDGYAVGSDRVAKRALEMIGEERNYNFILDNCHQFTSGCLSGDFENSDNFFQFLKSTTEEYLEANEWRVWNLEE